MQSVYQAALRSWSIPPVATFALLLTALVYLRGWINLRRAGSIELPPWRAITFLAGLLSLWVALASPLDTFSGFVLTAHMLQHMLLMMVAPPADSSGRTSYPHRARIATLRCPRICWTISELAGSPIGLEPH